MKKLLISILLTLIPSVLNAQSDIENRPLSNHILRAGVGVNIDSNYSLGPSMSIEYQYSLSDYFDLGIGISYVNYYFKSGDYYNASEDVRNYTPSLQLVFTPFPKSFRFFQFGIGTGVRFVGYSYGKKNTHNITGYEYYEYTIGNYVRWAIVLPIRLHIIDNSKYQLSLDGLLNMVHRSDRTPYFLWSRTITSLYFGVKF